MVRGGVAARLIGLPAIPQPNVLLLLHMYAGLLCHWSSPSALVLVANYHGT